MEKNGNVLLLTLVDFLLQIIFFGLFCFVVFSQKDGSNGKSLENTIQVHFPSTSQNDLREMIKQLPESTDKVAKLTYNNEQVLSELKRQGYSNVAELTDDLSKLAPVKDLKSLQSKLGDERSLAKIDELLASAGGYEKFKELVGRGVGAPHCAPRIVSNIKRGTPIAKVVALDSNIRIEEVYDLPGFSTFSLKLKPHLGRTLSFSEFRQLFKPLIADYGVDCRHTITVKEETELKHSGRIIEEFFRLALQ